MRIFLAGIMQGSHRAAEMHDQDYRQRLKGLLLTHLPDCHVYDPLADHRQSLGYDESKGRATFFTHNHLCREVDAVVAVVPEASMGTAIEMWECHQAGGAVITISPLAHNWAVRFLSHALYPDEATFETALAAGEIAELIRSLTAQRGHDAGQASR